MCRLEPIAEVTLPGQPKITYVKVNPQIARDIVKEHLVNGNPLEKFTVGRADRNSDEPDIKTVDDIRFYRKQKRLALKNCGLINPESLDEYIACDGYKALYLALTQMSSHDVIEEIKKSGLRGRGGAGFSTGLKWQFAFNSVSDKKYVCCNADEGDPGAFMDRAILEGDPHSVLEAMAIAGYAIGSDQGYIYVRAEYPIAVKRLQLAIEQAKAAGLLGERLAFIGGAGLTSGSILVYT